MTAVEFVVVLAASPIVLALIYGGWKFSAESDANDPKVGGSA
ncbi:MAG: hypothetical protein OXR62_15740 [Ahrensia sp.]|nr:hypothetical protein [Ahrensia sp.]